MVIDLISFDTIEKGNDFNKAQDLYNEVLSSKEMIKCTAPRRKKKTTLIWKEFVKGYRKDLQAQSNLSSVFNNHLKLLL